MVAQEPLLLNPKKLLPLPLRILTSPKTTVALGAVLGTLLFPAAVGAAALGLGKSLVPKTAFGALKTFVGVPLVGGVLLTSPKVRGAVKKIFSPKAQVERGKFIGGLIEDPRGLLPQDVTGKGVKERIKDIAKSAGLIGGAAAAVVGGVVLGKKALEKAKGLLPSKDVILTAGTPAAVITATPLPSIVEPLGAVQPEKPIELEKVPIAMPSIRITNKPEINIRFSKSRKFINQQILVNS